jgi:hypothetical protein
MCHLFVFFDFFVYKFRDIPIYANFRLKEKEYHQKTFSIGNGVYERGHHKTTLTRQGKILIFDLVISNERFSQGKSSFVTTFV